MPVFQYKAVGGDGALAEGQVEAQGRQDALRVLETRGLRPVRLDDSKDGPRTQKAPGKGFHRKKVSLNALENFMRQLSSLLAAGVPLSRSLQILQKEASNPHVQERWKNIHDLVIDGTPLADAMAKSEGTFSNVHVAMVRAGETGGFLDVVLGQIADFQRREKEIRSSVLSALIYPAVLICLGIAVLIFLLTFFIPRFKIIFDDFDATLPALTQGIVFASEWLRSYGVFMLIGIVAIYLCARNWLQSEQGRRTWQRHMLRLPVIGPLTARFAMTRFCRMLGTLIGAGVPLTNALRVARESIGNQTLTDAVTKAIERVKKGDSLASSLADCTELFPGSVLEMIAVAEETGGLEKELVRLAGVTESELDRRLKSAVSLAEPLILFVMAGFVGLIFFGMVLPIFTLQDYIK